MDAIASFDQIDLFESFFDYVLCHQKIEFTKRPPKKVANRAIRYSGLGIPSVVLVGFTLDLVGLVPTPRKSGDLETVEVRNTSTPVLNAEKSS